MSQGFRYQGHIYPTVQLTRVTPRDIVSINRALMDAGSAVTWGGILSTSLALQDAGDDQQRLVEFAGSEVGVMTAQVLVWAALHYGGLSDLTFSDALDIPQEDVEQVEVPEDHAGPKGQPRRKNPDSGRDAETAA